MTILTPTKQHGATTKANEVLYVEPGASATDSQLKEQMRTESVNSAFVADLLSAFLAHERCGRHLYRSVAGRTHNPLLQQKYEEFGRETEHHVEILEGLVTKAGGNPAYVSPMARAVEASDSKLVEATFLASGSLDVMTAEMAMLDAVFLAEAADQANWEAVAKIAEVLPVGALASDFRAAAQGVLAEENEHLGWAKQTKARLVVLQAKSATVAKAGAKMEEAVAAIKDWFR